MAKHPMSRISPVEQVKILVNIYFASKIGTARNICTMGHIFPFLFGFGKMNWFKNLLGGWGHFLSYDGPHKKTAGAIST